MKLIRPKDSAIIKTFHNIAISHFAGMTLKSLVCYTGRQMNSIDLSIFSSRINAICDEMGAVLKKAAFSPNIKDRLDFSCAIFDHSGELCAQAAHIPVHLGSMAYAMTEIVQAIDWSPGDMLILNDPYLGGTHLPDVTLVASVFAGDSLAGFVVNRAHHADIGCHSPGSMPVSRSLEEEGLVIAPQPLLRQGTLDQSLLRQITAVTARPVDSRADLSAQISANKTGVRRLLKLIDEWGLKQYRQGLAELNGYAQRLARHGLKSIPLGHYRFTDYMESDGSGRTDLPVQVEVSVRETGVHVDFSGTAPQVEGNINCPLSVTAAAVYYVFRCLMPAQTPASAGAFRDIGITAPAGCLVNARRPAAVAAGNVETSSRIVDALLGALHQAVPEQVPAASQGTMNNLAMGSSATAGEGWSYYETLAGGMGAGAHGGGLSAVQTHMTNTLNTPVEVVETRFPLRIQRYQVRAGSGGRGRRQGGDGLIREYRFLAPASVTLLTERRRLAPWGLAGGEAGRPGVNRLNRQPLAAKCSLAVNSGDVLEIQTPGGGGYGRWTD